MSEIVKVQRPLSGGPQWLVYGKGKSRMQQLHPVPDEVVRAMREDAKGYFEAEFKEGGWVIGKRVGEQDW